MQKDLYEFIIGELKGYKMNCAVYESLLIENELGISAQALSEVPRSVTNKFSSITENQALNHPPSHILGLELRRVKNWLNALHDEEKYVVENFYIHNRSYNYIINNWRIEQTRDYWHRKRIVALNMIAELENKRVQNTKIIHK